ncbi:T9SS type A sorting domain-containing protein [Ulvibacter litoralis]|uniref:Por secretion system C-terminal sorting domain-containing protein n=2 Tax=Ulvibacter litoralis TaxID=227084 RepID=A0A1G7HL08_9FLAO|nr:T9SS type A sorting domain-containing protein [Ulvibacter litoralis]GHC58226.1 hypothetical protein GCM10008083_23650 [Ulvibacter litoralis]SDF01078.1 Por secretion system C-terminal sorting domain-containing protein [Ulvibacter litoralis]
MFKKLLFIAVVFSVCQTFAQNTIKTMFYNLLEFPRFLPGDRSILLQDILDNYEPDIFMVCELQSQNGSDQVLNIALNDEGANYSAAPFVLNQSSSDTDLQQMLYYRSSMFTLVYSEVIPTEVRDINRYVLRLNTEDQGTDPVLIEVYVTHLKSSQGSANQTLRLNMVTELTDHFANIDPDSFVIFSGDFNLYRATEPAYEEILDPTNAIVLVDPINRPGSWSSNTSFQDIHTQSTRTSSGPFGAGAGGGLDDRFDFIMISENMQTDPKLRYVPDTYKAYGNNGNCYNQNINNVDCIGVFDQTTRDNIYNMSDHLPVVMELETNKEIVLSTSEFEATTLQIELENTIVVDELRLQIAPTISETVSFTIYNTLGQNVLTAPASTSKTRLINVSHLTNGVYYLKNNQSLGNPIKFLKTS